MWRVDLVAYTMCTCKLALMVQLALIVPWLMVHLALMVLFGVLSVACTIVCGVYSASCALYPVTCAWWLIASGF